MTSAAIARELTYALNIGRVIARPFVGDDAGPFTRTAHRKDFAVPPPSPTLLDVLTQAGRDVVSIGKIGDIFAHRGTGREIKVGGQHAWSMPPPRPHGRPCATAASS